MQELELKLQGGGLMHEVGGVFAGFYGTCIYMYISDHYIILHPTLSPPLSPPLPRVAYRIFFWGVGGSHR